MRPPLTPVQASKRKPPPHSSALRHIDSQRSKLPLALRRHLILAVCCRNPQPNHRPQPVVKSHAMGLLTITLADGQVTAMTRFDNAVLPRFGLPRSLP